MGGHAGFMAQRLGGGSTENGSGLTVCAEFYEVATALTCPIGVAN